MDRALRTKSSDESTTIVTSTSGSNSNAPDLVKSIIQDSDRDVMINTSYSKNQNRDYTYGSSYLNNTDRKNLYRNTSENYDRKYNHMPSSNSDDNYMDMTYSSKNMKSAKQEGEFSSKNLFYDKYSDNTSNYISKTRNSAFEDLSTDSSRRQDFVTKNNEFIPSKTAHGNNYYNDDLSNYSKDSKLSNDSKYFVNEKNNEEEFGSDSIASEQTSSDVPMKNQIAKDSRFSDNTIDKLLAAPSKILIPERYIPEQVSFIFNYEYF